MQKLAIGIFAGLEFLHMHMTEWSSERVKSTPFRAESCEEWSSERVYTLISEWSSERVYTLIFRRLLPLWGGYD